MRESENFPSCAIQFNIPPNTILSNIPPKIIPSNIQPDTIPSNIPPDTIPSNIAPNTIPSNIPPNTIPSNFPPNAIPSNIPSYPIPSNASSLSPTIDRTDSGLSSPTKDNTPEEETEDVFQIPNARVEPTTNLEAQNVAHIEATNKTAQLLHSAQICTLNTLVYTCENLKTDHSPDVKDTGVSRKLAATVEFGRTDTEIVNIGEQKDILQRAKVIIDIHDNTTFNRGKNAHFCEVIISQPQVITAKLKHDYSTLDESCEQCRSALSRYRKSSKALDKVFNLLFILGVPSGHHNEIHRALSRKAIKTLIQLLDDESMSLLQWKTVKCDEPRGIDNICH